MSVGHRHPCLLASVFRACAVLLFPLARAAADGNATCADPSLVPLSADEMVPAWPLYHDEVVGLPSRESLLTDSRIMLFKRDSYFPVEKVERDQVVGQVGLMVTDAGIYEFPAPSLKREVNFAPLSTQLSRGKWTNFENPFAMRLEFIGRRHDYRTRSAILLYGSVGIRWRIKVRVRLAEVEKPFDLPPYKILDDQVVEEWGKVELPRVSQVFLVPKSDELPLHAPNADLFSAEVEKVAREKGLEDPRLPAVQAMLTEAISVHGELEEEMKCKLSPLNQPPETQAKVGRWLEGVPSAAISVSDSIVDCLTRIDKADSEEEIRRKTLTSRLFVALNALLLAVRHESAVG